MAIDFQRQRFQFAPISGVANRMEVPFFFPSTVRKAEAVINGFEIGYTDSDHHLWRMEIDTTVQSITAGTVKVLVRFAVRDASGNFDDRYDGFVDVLVIVDRD